MTLSFLPTLNAFLNGTSALFLLTGFYFIRVKKNQKAHALCMVSALTISALFLISYLTYHYFHGSEPFLGEGFIRLLYFSILISHTILAIVILPLIAITLFYAVRKNFAKHKRIAQWTFPIWLYVSITGVIVYLMLYHWLSHS